jgi:uncharacterized protein (TIGR02598 family)
MTPRDRTNAAFSLVEVTLSLGIAAFCLIAVFGLMPIGVQTNRNATSQATATNVIAAVMADLRATPRCIGTSTQFQITLGTGPGCPTSVSPSAATLYFDGTGHFATSLGANSRYQLNVTWYGSSTLRYANLKVTWPAAADPATTTPSGSVEMFAAFDRN